MKLAMPPSLHSSATTGDLEDVSSRLSSGEPVDALDMYGSTALHCAANKGHAAVVDVLLRFGANPNALGQQGWTPLHYAANKGHLAVAQLLVDWGSDLTRSDGDGRTPADLALSRGRGNVYEFLKASPVSSQRHIQVPSPPPDGRSEPSVTQGVRGLAARVLSPMESAPPKQDASPSPYDGEAPYLFVSYKRDDWRRVEPFLRRAVSWGYNVWYDKEIPGGAEWDALIEERIQSCSLLLLFLSKASAESRWIRREIKFADRMQKPIVTIRLEEAALRHGLDMLLSQYQMIEASSGDFAHELERAIRYVRLL